MGLTYTGKWGFPIVEFPNQGLLAMSINISIHRTRLLPSYLVFNSLIFAYLDRIFPNLQIRQRMYEEPSRCALHNLQGSVGFFIRYVLLTVCIESCICSWKSRVVALVFSGPAVTSYITLANVAAYVSPQILNLLTCVTDVIYLSAVDLFGILLLYLTEWEKNVKISIL